MAIVDSRTNLWEVIAGREPGQPLAPADVDLWQAVSDRLNPARATPNLRDGIEEAKLTSVRDEDYVMLRSPDDGSPAYLRLAPEEIELAHRMDGTRTVASLVGEFANITGTLAPDRVLRLVADLAGNKMLEELPVDSFHPLQRYRSHRGPLPDRFTRGLLATIRGQRMVLANPDRVVGWIYRAGGRFLFTRTAAVILAFIAVAGLVLFARTWLGGAQSIFLVDGSYVQGALLLLGLNVVALTSHELGHGLAAKHAGRHVPAVGVLLYFGLPSVFVDTTDVWMAGRKARILTSAAGPVAALVFAGGIQLAALVSPALGLIAFKIAFVWYLNSLFNLNPLMALDGYYLFMDWLELPNLRPKAMALIAGWARNRRPRWSDLDKEGKLIALYALLALGWVIVMINLSIRIWRDRVGGLVTGLWHSGTWARALMIAVVVGLATPIVFAILGYATRLWSRMRTAAQERRRERDLPRRVDALRSSALGALAERDLVELASEAEWVHPRRGTRVLGGPGPAPTQALVVVEGALEGRRDDDPPGTIRHRAHPGDVARAHGGASTLAWITAGTTLLSVPLRILGEKLSSLLDAVPPSKQQEERERLFAPLLARQPVPHPSTSIVVVGAHSVDTYPPLAPRPGSPGPGNDERDDRFRRSLLLLLLLALLLALSTAPIAFGQSAFWAEMPPHRVLLEVTRGEVVFNPESEDVLLSEGEKRYLTTGDEIEVLVDSNATLTFDGGGAATLCSLSETGIGELDTDDSSPLAPHGEVRLERGTIIADTASLSDAYLPLGLTVTAGGHTVVNEGEATYAVSSSSNPVQLIEGAVDLNGTPQSVTTEPIICPSHGGEPIGTTTTTTEPTEATTTTEQTTTTVEETTTTAPETTTTIPEETTTAPPTTTPTTTPPTTVPPTTSPPTTSPPTTSPPTTQPVPPPVIGSVGVTEPYICTVSTGEPTTTTVTVSVSDADSVQLTWAVNTISGNAQMKETGLDTWSYTLPVFSPSALDPGEVEALISINVTATNSVGTASGTTSVLLLNCSGTP